MAAQENARQESAVVMGPPAPPEPDLHAVARQMHPEVFQQYDSLSAQRDQFRKTIADAQNPPDDVLAEATSKRDTIQEQLDQVPTTGAGRNLVEARRLRAQVRDAQRGIDDLNERRTSYAEGRAVDTPEVTAARQQLQAVDYQMRDLAPDVSAYYLRAPTRPRSTRAR